MAKKRSEKVSQEGLSDPSKVRFPKSLCPISHQNRIEHTKSCSEHDRAFNVGKLFANNLCLSILE